LATPDIQREIWIAPSAVEAIGWVEYVGERFGKYRLERKLAVGGMAEIFLATHQGPEGFKKHVAIKRILLRPAPARPGKGLKCWFS
jgi:hypothetical protein